MHFKFLKDMYDKKIRCECQDSKVCLDICLTNNFFKEEYCQQEVNSFLLCVDNFNKVWRKKYKNYTFSIN